MQALQGKHLLHAFPQAARREIPPPIREAATRVGRPGPVCNVATKLGVSGLTKSAAPRYATQGMRVNAVDSPLGHLVNFNDTVDEKVVLVRERIGVDVYGNTAGEAVGFAIFDNPKVSV